jgi:hypothetical protein
LGGNKNSFWARACFAATPAEVRDQGCPRVDLRILYGAKEEMKSKIVAGIIKNLGFSNSF